MKTIKKVYGILLITTIFLSACGEKKQNTSAENGKKNNTVEQVKSNRVLAIVNGESIFENDLQPLLQAGIDKAIALDRYINRIITAQTALKDYENESKSALKQAERDILSNLYMQQETQKFEKLITEDDLKKQYEQTVRPEDYRKFKAKYYLSNDAQDAGNVAELAANGDTNVKKSFNAIKNNDDSWLRAQDFPYGIGQIIKQLKAGEFSKPIATRNGFFIVWVEETKENSPPTFDRIKGELKNLLIAQRISSQIDQKRAEAKIELK